MATDLDASQDGGSDPPFFMTVTIEVDGEALPNDWQAQQESNPADEVDLFVLSEDLTEGTPTSAPKAEDPAPEGKKKGK